MIRSWGISIGKPRIAMIAAFCPALAAMAARKEKTRLSVKPPRNTSVPNKTAFCSGKPRNMENNRKEMRPMISIRTALKASFARIKV